MNISTIIAEALGIILLLVWLVFIPAGKVCFRQMRALLLWKPTDNLNEELELWLQQAGNFQKITVPIIHKAIIRTWAALSVGKEGLIENGCPRCENVDNFFARMTYSMYIIQFRWHILPFIIGVGLILSGNLWLILALPAAWILSLLPLFPYCSLMYVLGIVSGWFYGGLVYSRLFSGSRLWYYVSSGVGVLCMLLVYTVIFAIMTIIPMRGRYGYR